MHIKTKTYDFFGTLMPTWNSENPQPYVRFQNVIGMYIIVTRGKWELVHFCNAFVVVTSLSGEIVAERNNSFPVFIVTDGMFASSFCIFRAFCEHIRVLFFSFLWLFLNVFSIFPKRNYTTDLYSFFPFFSPKSNMRALQIFTLFLWKADSLVCSLFSLSVSLWLRLQHKCWHGSNIVILCFYSMVKNNDGKSALISKQAKNEIDEASKSRYQGLFTDWTLLHICFTYKTPYNLFAFLNAFHYLCTGKRQKIDICSFIFLSFFTVTRRSACFLDV